MRRCIGTAIVLHNRFDLPDGLDPMRRFVCEVVRDADKLDIARVILDHVSLRGKGKSAITHSLKTEASRYSPEVLDRVARGRKVSYGDLEWENDFLLLLLGWADSLARPMSLRLFLENGVIANAAMLLPTSHDIADAVEAVQKRLIRRLSVTADG